MTNIYREMDKMITDFNKVFSQGNAGNYPRYNVWTSEDKYGVEMLVPGLTKDELEVEFKPGLLIIRGQKRTEDKKYLDKGFSSKAFEQRFTVDTGMKVSDVSLDAGILSISIERDKENSNLLEIH